MTRRSSAHSLALSAALAAGALLGLGCTNGTGTSTGTSGPSTTATGPTTTVPSSYATIAELSKAMNDKGIACELEYPGLKDDASQAELSVCTVDNEQAFLRVWQSPDLLQTFVSGPDGQSGTVAVGANWTISFQTAALANKVATALGGRVPGTPAT